MRVVKLLGSAMAGAALVGVVLPANAQSWRGGWHRGPYRHYHGDRIDGGDVLLGAVLAGGLIALVSSANKPKPVAVPRDVPPPEPAYDAPPPAESDGDAPPPAYGDENAEAEAPPPPGGGDYADSAFDEDSAADRCAAAAEEKGQAFARIARVSDVSDVRREGPSWLVSGRLEFADSYRERQRASRGFRCTLSDGVEPRVQFDPPAVGS